MSVAAFIAFSLTLQISPSEVSVTDFGAIGDGRTDDTAAFGRAMAAVSEKGGTVKVPIGNFMIRSHLAVPAQVALEGVWRIPTTFTQNLGSTLLAVEGAGSEVGAPFISLSSNSALKGLTIFYPNQKPEKIQAYPWCVQGAGDNASVVDCLLVNPYQGVDFGTHPCGRHYVRGLYGQPLRRGIFVDQCYDIGRIENVHFWPFWNWDEKNGIRDWWWKNGEAFIFGRTDWEYVLNTFCFGYRVGYHFIKTANGAMNGNLLGIGADATNVAVQVDETQPYGLLITNGEFVSFAGDRPTEVVVGPSHTGSVQFQNCSFWGPAYQIGRIEGTGLATFQNCNFRDYDFQNKLVPTFDLVGGHLTVSGSTFSKKGPQAVIRSGARSAIFSSNVFAGPPAIRNEGKAQVQIGLNVAGRE